MLSRNPVHAQHRDQIGVESVLTRILLVFSVPDEMVDGQPESPFQLFKYLGVRFGALDPKLVSLAE